MSRLPFDSLMASQYSSLSIQWEELAVKVMLSLAGLGALASVCFVSPPAQAAGCGGYVNVFVHGCAPWDNNPRRMPGAPGYVAPRAAPVAAPRVAAPVAAPPRIVQPTTGNRLISDRGGGFISTNGSTFISTNGGTMRR